MPVESSVQVTRDIETLFAAGTTTGLSDRQLLERFSSGRDASAEAAFEAIVRRHGPMVLRLCYKMLANQADAEEAFQATFLILVKKCRSIRQLDTVGGWLFGVASRVAARAQVERSRRRTAERQGGLRIATAMDTHGDSSERVELDAAVEAEVLRLPE
jgi:RNA polymerase sigma factor (sigma-70 family)